jgi:carboxypeptidase Taq
MRTRIHVHGAKFFPEELTMKVAGEPINPRPFLDYLKQKYSEIYGKL